MSDISEEMKRKNVLPVLHLLVYHIQKTHIEENHQSVCL